MELVGNNWDNISCEVRNIFERTIDDIIEINIALVHYFFFCTVSCRLFPFVK